MWKTDTQLVDEFGDWWTEELAARGFAQRVEECKDAGDELAWLM